MDDVDDVSDDEKIERFVKYYLGVDPAPWQRRFITAVLEGKRPVIVVPSPRYGKRLAEEYFNEMMALIESATPLESPSMLENGDPPTTVGNTL